MWTERGSCMLDPVTCYQRVIWCVMGSSYTGFGIPWAQRIECKASHCALTPPPLWAKSPHAPLVCCCWQGARLIMCSLLQPKRAREGEWEGSSRLPPQACRLPRPQHYTNESRGSGWAHTRGQGLLPRAKRSQRERDPRKGGEETPAETPEADLYSCSHLNLTLFCFYDVPGWVGISADTCL